MKIDLNKLVNRCNELDATKRLVMNEYAEVEIQFISIDSGAVIETADAELYAEKRPHENPRV